MITLLSNTYEHMKQSTEKQREYWRKTYHRRKHLPSQIKARREREKVRRKKWRTERVFMRLAKYQRKRNGATTTAIDLWRICLRQRCRCALTGRTLTAENMSVDHIIPMEKGGGLDVGNLRLTVKPANYAKWTLTDDELLALAKDIIKTIG